MFMNRGVSVKGNTYWWAEGRSSNSDHHNLIDYIICFDFTRERFGPLLPLPCSTGRQDYVTLSCVRDEKLAVLLQHTQTNLNHLEIWITTKIEAEKVSWSRFLAMETVHPIYIPRICGDFFIDEEKKVAMGFNQDYPRTFGIIGENGYSIKLDLGGPDENGMWQPYGCSYVPSLVQIKEPAQVKRKGEDSSEKLRFEQYRSRLAVFEEYE